MEVEVVNRINLVTSDIVDIGRNSVDRLEITSDSRAEVNVVDSYILTPLHSAHTLDYEVPASITEGLFADIDKLRADLLEKASNQELTLLETTIYNKTNELQQLIDIQAAALSNEALEAKVMAMDFSSYAIRDEDGVVTATMQEISNRSVAVASSMADISDEINVIATKATAAVEHTNTLEAEVEAKTTEVDELIKTLQNRIDGVIVSWYDTYVPSQDNLPWSDWVTSDTEYEHTGDLFYNLDDGTAYRFAKVNDVYGWSVVTDTAVAKALHDASVAKDTADGKRRVFINTPTSDSEYDIGDLWSRNIDGRNELWRATTAKLAGSTYSIDHWIQVSTDDSYAQAQVELINTDLSNKELAIATVGEDLNTFSTIVIDKIDTVTEYYAQSTEPTWDSGDNNKHHGDVWRNTSTNKITVYNSADDTWVEDEATTLAYTKAIDAGLLASSKASIYYNSDDKSNAVVGDLWIVEDTTDPLNNDMLQFDGTEWKSTAVIKKLKVSQVSNEYAMAGQFIEYISGDPVTGNYRDNNGTYEVYLGTEWEPITNSEFANFQAGNTVAGAKSLAVENDTIVGWEYTTGLVGSSEFTVHADKFMVSDGNAITSPIFTVNTESDTIDIAADVHLSGYIDCSKLQAPASDEDHVKANGGTIIDSKGLRVYDENGTLRVQIGEL